MKDEILDDVDSQRDSTESSRHSIKPMLFELWSPQTATRTAATGRTTGRCCTATLPTTTTGSTFYTDIQKKKSNEWIPCVHECRQQIVLDVLPSTTLANTVNAISSIPPNNRRIHVDAICAVSLPPLSKRNKLNAGPIPNKMTQKEILYNTANNSGVHPPTVSSHTYLPNRNEQGEGGVGQQGNEIKRHQQMRQKRRRLFEHQCLFVRSNIRQFSLYCCSLCFWMWADLHSHTNTKQRIGAVGKKTVPTQPWPRKKIVSTLCVGQPFPRDDSAHPGRSTWRTPPR